MNTARLPTYFISHGGGPWPYIMEQSGGMYDCLARLTVSQDFAPFGNRATGMMKARLRPGACREEEQIH